jgi:hypothetical protein
VAVRNAQTWSRGPLVGSEQLVGTGYVRTDGELTLSVDPAHPANRTIVDLESVSRDSIGEVSFASEFCLVQPEDPEASNGGLLVVVPNRGRIGVIPLSGAPMPAVMSAHIDLGDGFLLAEGWSILWVGWQWDVIRRAGMVGLLAPEATVDPSDRPVVFRFQPNEPRTYQRLSHWPLFPPPGNPEFDHAVYPVDGTRVASAVLTVRDRPDSPPAVVPSAAWMFGRVRGGEVESDLEHVWLEGGFQPGSIYEVTYSTTTCPVVGAGLLAVRDVVAHLRHETETGSAFPIDYAVAFGSSQSGRFLREFLFQGLNEDEAGNRVFDGVLAHVAGAHRGEFNQRYGQPSAQYVPGPGMTPPFVASGRGCIGTSCATTGLLDNLDRLGMTPRVFFTNTSNEYWRNQASLIHACLDCGRDADEHPAVRHYLFSGTQHGPGSLPLTRWTISGASTANEQNSVDYTPLLRAALYNLARWVDNGIDPPPSEIPRRSDGTATEREAVLHSLEHLPDVCLPLAGDLPSLRPLDVGPMGYPAEPIGEPYRVFVSDVDSDSNEVAGIRLPDLAVPLATHTGWNPRHPSIGAAGQLLDTFGSTIPFPNSATERERSDDPRASIAERYGSMAEYSDAVRTAAEELVSRRQLLIEDLETVVRFAESAYRSFIGDRDNVRSRRPAAPSEGGGSSSASTEDAG